MPTYDTTEQPETKAMTFEKRSLYDEELFPHRQRYRAILVILNCCLYAAKRVTGQ